MKTTAWTVTGISAAPSLDTDHGLFRFQTAEAGEVTLAVPRDRLPGLAGLAMGYGRTQSGQVQALDVTAFDVALMSEPGKVVLTLTASDSFGAVSYALAPEAARALRDLLASPDLGLRG